jgi:hypothetical protein
MPPESVSQTSIRNQIPTDEKMPSGFPRRFLFFSFLLFLAVLLVYFGLTFGYKPALNRSIENLEGELDNLSAQITSEQQDNLIRVHSQITNITKLFSNHVFASKMFSVIEKNTENRVAYKSLDIDVPSMEITLEGIAGSYDDLVSQLAIYEQAKEIERVVLQSSKLEGTAVSFRVGITLAPETLSL